MINIRRFFSDLSQYPSAVVGMVLILLLVVFSIYTIIALPYDEAISLWRGDENVWYKTPKTAQPTWINWFLKDDLPETFIFNSATDESTKTEEFSNETNKILISSLLNIIPRIFHRKFRSSSLRNLNPKNPSFPSRLSLLMDVRLRLAVLPLERPKPTVSHKIQSFNDACKVTARNKEFSCSCLLKSSS